MWLASISITRAPNSYQSTTLHVIVNITPLNITIKAEAIMVTYWLMLNNDIGLANEKGLHTQPHKNARILLFNVILFHIRLCKKKVNIMVVTRVNWHDEVGACWERGTDGSKTNEGV